MQVKSQFIFLQYYWREIKLQLCNLFIFFWLRLSQALVYQLDLPRGKGSLPLVVAQLPQPPHQGRIVTYPALQRLPRCGRRGRGAIFHRKFAFSYHISFFLQIYKELFT